MTGTKQERTADPIGDDNKKSALDERLSRFDRAVDGVARFIYGGVDLAFRTLDGILCLFAEALCLGFEVVACIFEIVSGVLNSPAELFARFDPSLRSIKQCNRCSGAYTDAESKPVMSCAHSKYLVLGFAVLNNKIRWGRDWLAFRSPG
jgi:hypothetical protein